MKTRFTGIEKIRTQTLGFTICLLVVRMHHTKNNACLLYLE
jgi:hypothetical protein